MLAITIVWKLLSFYYLIVIQVFVIIIVIIIIVIIIIIVNSIIGIQSAKGNTCYLLAAQKGIYQYLKLWWWLLLLSLWIGYLDIVKVLTPFVDVNVTNKGGDNALNWAAYNGHEDIVEFLLSLPNINTDSADDKGHDSLKQVSSSSSSSSSSLLLYYYYIIIIIIKTGIE